MPVREGLECVWFSFITRRMEPLQAPGVAPASLRSCRGEREGGVVGRGGVSLPAAFAVDCVGEKSAGHG